MITDEQTVKLINDICDMFKPMINPHFELSEDERWFADDYLIEQQERETLEGMMI